MAFPDEPTPFKAAEVAQLSGDAPAACTQEGAAFSPEVGRGTILPDAGAAQDPEAAEIDTQLFSSLFWPKPYLVSFFKDANFAPDLRVLNCRL